VSDLVRTFFALELPEELRTALVAVQGSMREVPGRGPIRWARVEQLHVTLKFLGDVSAEQVAALAEIARRRGAEFPPLAVRVTSVIAFGGPRRARAFVAELESSPELAALAEALESDAEALGIAREARPFRPHITLARLKRPGDARAWLDAARLEPLEAELGELRFYQSTLSAEGGVYNVLCSAELSRAG
jgi:RNA 2',3'-cyclic 3'-phosphodiesterase